jgi:preprotein translocase subunit SecA
MFQSWPALATWFSGARKRVDPRLIDDVRRVAALHAGPSAAGNTAAVGNTAAPENIPARPGSPSVAEGLGRFVAAAQNELGLLAYDVQIQAAAALSAGGAVEMQTGEGKTLVAAAAAAALALAGRTVHVATVNAYLAERDFRLFAPVFERLGLRASRIYAGQSPAEKARAYAQRIVYGTGYEFGFDYLREQLRLIRDRSPGLGDRYRRFLGSRAVETPIRMTLDCAIIDEMDGVLLDEACVPLVLSEAGGGSNEDPELVAAACRTAQSLRRDEHFVVDPLHRTLTPTAAGLAAIDLAVPAARASRLRRPWRSYVQEALVAAWILDRDVDYLVADGRIWLVDGSTGRVFDDRRWPEGLEQAVEHKEGVEFSAPTFGAARITRQRFFTLYRSLSGTSGTLAEEADELRETYGLGLSIVPPNRPSQRVERPTLYFADDRARTAAVVAEAVGELGRGRPVLVGCRTIQAADGLARAFTAAGVSHRLLSGRQDEDEARIIAEAGRSGRLTVATNLAGRGTDIRLDDGKNRAGGLHVIGVERHDSSRVDRQLLGRAGRQGDFGSGRFFVSADDAILRPFPAAADRIAALAAGRPAVDLDREVGQCQRALEAQARLRRRETAAHNGRLDDLVDLLSKSE